MTKVLEGPEPNPVTARTNNFLRPAACLDCGFGAVPPSVECECDLATSTVTRSWPTMTADSWGKK